jgi:hypothetical protein
VTSNKLNLAKQNSFDRTLDSVQTKLSEVRVMRFQTGYIDAIISFAMDKTLSKKYDGFRAMAIREIGEIVIDKMYEINLDAKFLALQVDLTPKRLKRIYDTINDIAANEKPTRENKQSIEAAKIMADNLLKTFGAMEINYDYILKIIETREAVDTTVRPTLRTLLRQKGIMP